MHFKLSLFIFIWSVKSLEGKASDNFDSAYYHIAVNVSGEDINQAIFLADSLYKVSEDDFKRMKSKMLLATLQSQIGERESAFKNAIEAEKISEINNWLDWQARICGFLATQLRNSDLIQEGRFYLEKGFKIINSLAPSKEKDRLKGTAFQEFAYQNMYENTYDSAIVYLQQAEEAFNKLDDGPSKLFFLATNDELLAKCYIRVENTEAAKFHFYRAIDNINAAGANSSPLLGFVYTGLGRINLLEKDYDSAISFFEKAEEIAEISNFLNLKLEVFEQLSIYYLEKRDYQKSQFYEAKIKDSMLKEKKSNSALAQSHIENIRNISTSDQSKSYLLYLGLVCVLAFLLVIFKKVYPKKNKYDIHSRSKLSTKTHVNVLSEKKSRNDQQIHLEPKIEINELMPIETEEVLLNKLIEFEKSTKFTEKGLSLPALSAKMKTNTKYLSYVIKKHRNNDFNNYINELRINFIVKKILENKKYQYYKISFLADESGFSSHSKFSVVFKQVKGVSPSDFLQSLKESDDKDSC